VLSQNLADAGRARSRYSAPSPQSCFYFFFPMPRYRFHTLDVFTDRAFGGNPLAVVLDADGLDTAGMQTIAREFNLSETVFVQQPAQPGPARRKVRIFTPHAELPFAGHPTIGTSYLLATLGLVKMEVADPCMVLEENIGDVPVRVTLENGVPVATQMSVPRMPERGTTAPTRAALAALLSLPEAGVSGEAAVWSCGVPFLFVPVRDLDAMASVKLRPDLWEATLAPCGARGVYPYTMHAQTREAQVHARMFAPGLGVAEDPATGAAASALAGALQAASPAEGSRRWRIEQGFEMGRPSLIDLEADVAGGRIAAVRVGGRSVAVSEGWLTVPG
jgi:trans-2,3-dihydro-3-hydroxyanthranilate isomerase